MHKNVKLISPRAYEEVYMNKDDYQHHIEAEDDNDYLGAVEGMSYGEEGPVVSDASWCESQECWLEMSPSEI